MSPVDLSSNSKQDPLATFLRSRLSEDRNTGRHPEKPKETTSSSSFTKADEHESVPHPRGIFDLIIEDGLHTVDAQQKTLLNFWPYLKKGGLYVAEDLGSARDTANIFAQKVSGENPKGALLQDVDEILEQNPKFLVMTKGGDSTLLVVNKMKELGE